MSNPSHSAAMEATLLHSSEEQLPAGAQREPEVSRMKVGLVKGARPRFVDETARLVSLVVTGALMAALGYAQTHGFKALKVISDSELMVRQIEGRYKVKSPSLLPLYQQAKQMIRQLDWFRIAHTLREGNQEADRLANLAMDEGRRGATPGLARED